MGLRIIRLKWEGLKTTGKETVHMDSLSIGGKIMSSCTNIHYEYVREVTEFVLHVNTVMNLLVRNRSTANNLNNYQLLRKIIRSPSWRS